MTGSRARMLGSSSLSTGSKVQSQDQSTPPPSGPFSPLYNLLEDIDHCIASGLFLPALFVALSLPDICISLTLHKAKHVISSDYIAFIDKYTAPHELGCDGEYCYKLRGGVIHRGNAVGHSKNEDTHLVMTTPITQQKLHAFSVHAKDGSRKATVLDIEAFCGALQTAVCRWIEENRKNKIVLKNLPEMLSIRPNGIKPFVEGLILGSGPD